MLNELHLSFFLLIGLYIKKLQLWSWSSIFFTLVHMAKNMPRLECFTDSFGLVRRKLHWMCSCKFTGRILAYTSKLRQHESTWNSHGTSVTAFGFPTSTFGSCVICVCYRSSRRWPRCAYTAIQPSESQSGMWLTIREKIVIEYLCNSINSGVCCLSE
jgi:hypothetical protein